MAADSRAWSGHHGHPIGQKIKIRRLDDGRLIGASSNGPGTTEAVLEWYESGADPEKAPKDIDRDFVALLVVHPDGIAQIAYDHWRLSARLTAPWFTIGSGKEYAWGALAMGATADQAVEIACRADTCSAPPITTLRHE
ncbi:hypothetical protein NKH24_06850 [Mesorhizobium sp. M1300]|uniref:hypothetical protein n=1 Tax=Mesorhizobium sp. M1300 TaxID=2957077 RepID=UPI00333B11FA